MQRGAYIGVDSIHATTTTTTTKKKKNQKTKEIYTHQIPSQNLPKSLHIPPPPPQKNGVSAAFWWRRGLISVDGKDYILGGVVRSVGRRKEGMGRLIVFVVCVCGCVCVCIFRGRVCEVGEGGVEV